MYSRVRDFGFPILAISLPAALVMATVVFVEGTKAVVPSNQIVKVRGVAERAIESDRVDWTIRIAHLDADRDQAYARVDETVGRVLGYLQKRGFHPRDLTTTGPSLHERSRRIVLDKLGNDRTERTGFEVVRWVELKGSKKLDLVEKLASSIGADLVREGWPVEPHSPRYYFSKKVSDIKPELLREAARNAYERASIVAESSGSQLGGLRAARQGAFEGMGSDGYVGGSSPSGGDSPMGTLDRPRLPSITLGENPRPRAATL